jgi:preprotein translocase subunit SecG
VIWFISTVHVIVCLFLILVVLLQQGKGADLSVFGGGGTQAAFGARGATTLLHKLTVFSFIGFILTTMGIGLLRNTARSSSVLGDVPVPAVEEVVAPEPVVEETPAPAAADEAAAEEGAAEPEPMDEAGDGQ